jgi:hypothetical protein
MNILQINFLIEIKPLISSAFKKLIKNEIFVSHVAVGEDSNRGGLPWPVSPPATFAMGKLSCKSFLKSF